VGDSNPRPFSLAQALFPLGYIANRIQVGCNILWQYRHFRRFILLQYMQIWLSNRRVRLNSSFWNVAYIVVIRNDSRCLLLHRLEQHRRILFSKETYRILAQPADPCGNHFGDMIWKIPNPTLRRNNILVWPIQHDHGARTQHRLIYVLPIYCDCATAWSSTCGCTCLHRACVSSRASSCGACCCASSCGSNTYSANGIFAQATCILAQVVQMWVVIILRNTCIYMRPNLKSRSGPLTRRSVTWIVLYFFLDL